MTLPLLVATQMIVGLLTGLFVLTFFSGCQQRSAAKIWPKPPTRGPVGADQHTTLPPLIPEKVTRGRNADKPVSQGYTNPARLISQLQGTRWSDLPLPDTPWGVKLGRALSEAQYKIGILQPRQASSQFLPEAPVTLGTLAQWLMAWRTNRGPWETGNLAQALDQAKALGLLPFESNVTDPLTRLQLCHLYVKLAGLPEGGIDPAEAAPLEADAFETADQIQDWRWIAPVHRADVAWAYQRGVLQGVFELTPVLLIKGRGLEGNRPVTRAQALVFLQLTLSGDFNG